MVRDTLLGFPAHTLPYRRGKFITLSTASQGAKRRPVFHVYKMPVSRFETQRTRNSVPLHRITLLVVHLVHVGHEVQQLAGVAPFVRLSPTVEFPIKRLKIHRFRYDSLTFFALVYYQGS